MLFLVLAVVFLIGGLDAVEEVRRSVSRTLSVSSTMAPGFWKAARESPIPQRRPSLSSSNASACETAAGRGIAADFAPAFAQAPPPLVAALQDEEEGDHEAKDGFRDDPHQRKVRVAPIDFSENGSVPLRTATAMTVTTTNTRSHETAVGQGFGDDGLLLAHRTTASYGNRSVARPAAGAGGGREGGGGGGGEGGGAAIPENGGVRRPGEVGGQNEGGLSSSSSSSSSRCCGLGDKIKRWAARIPLDKLKILVVVWQILTVFPSITGADFPASYARFLSWVDIVNLDVGAIFSGSCILPDVNFYQRLLLTTLAPLVLALVLVCTFQMAKRRAGIGSASVIAKRAAWSRHMAAGLLLTFLVSAVAGGGGGGGGGGLWSADWQLDTSTVNYTR